MKAMTLKALRYIVKPQWSCLGVGCWLIASFLFFLAEPIPAIVVIVLAALVESAIMATCRVLEKNL